MAGPNGSGKTTLYTTAEVEDFNQSVWIINPDRLAARIAAGEHKSLPTANLEAVIRIENWLWASVDAYQTIGVETVLSTSKYRPLVTHARKMGFEIGLIYVVLDDVEKNIARVRRRVEQGGHDVPEDRIRKRYKRSLGQLPWFLRHADRAWLYDNSRERPALMAAKIADTITIYPAAFSVMRRILTSVAISGGHRLRLGRRAR